MRDLLIFANEQASRQSALVSTASTATPSFRAEQADASSCRPDSESGRSAREERNLSARCNV